MKWPPPGSTHLPARPALLPGNTGHAGANGERVHLARVLWHLLKFKQAFDWKVFEKEEQKRKKLARLQKPGRQPELPTRAQPIKKQRLSHPVSHEAWDM